MAEIPVLQAIELIRTRPEMYFDGGKPTMRQLISHVIDDISGTAAFKAEVHRQNEWALVNADVDWMLSEQASFEALFQRFVLPTPVRPNSFRAEILIVAVCKGMLTIGDAGRFSINLDEESVPHSMLKRALLAKRALIWTI